MDNVFFQLAVMLTMACVIGFVALRFRLPLVIAYLLAGVALSAYSISDTYLLITLPEIGIALVLFLIGMELNLTEIKALGRPIVVATLLQVIVSSIAGYGLATFFGFSGSEALVLGIALAFSSTIVIIKMLSERRDVSSLYGKLSIGILLMEDLVAILAMVAITENVLSFSMNMESLIPILAFTGKATALIVISFLASRFFLNPISHAVAKSTELLFLTAIAWCFVFTSLAVLAGFSVVIGAFLAGVALASSPYLIQIQGRIKPVRDFFVALFFIFIGSQVNLADISSSLPIIIGLTLLALLLKPLTYLVGLSFFSFRRRTLFQTSLNMTQVSEFSLIIVLLAVEYGYASDVALTVIASSAVLSIIVSSILMNFSESIYKVLKPFIELFHRKHSIELLPDETVPKLTDHVVVIGADRVGGVVIEYLKSANIETLILDYSPPTVRALRAKGYRTIYGDASDPEVLDNLQLETAKLIISTANGLRDNLALLDACKRKKTGAKIVVRSADEDNEPTLREAGATYVLLPERVTGDFLVSKLQDEWPNLRF